MTVTGHSLNDNKQIGERRRTISVHGDDPRDPVVERDNRNRRARSISVAGTGNAVGARTIGIYGHSKDSRRKQRTIAATGSTPQQNVVRNVIRETFSIEEGRKAMGIDWMPMSRLSQAIPPKYTEYIGLQLTAYLEWMKE